MKERMQMAGLFPLLAVLTIVVYAGGLGVLFMALNSTSLHEWAVVIVGLALVLGVPAAAAVLERMVERGSL